MIGPRLYRRWLACVLLVPAAAGAHHSRTQYEGSEIQEIQGELISVSWANPHAAFSVRVTSTSGESATWQLESWGSPYVLSRMGVTQDQFVVGTQVRLAGRVSKLVPNRFLLTNMLRPVQAHSSEPPYESESVHVHRTRTTSESIQSTRHACVPTD
jgi:hypothetical protein